MGWVRKAGSWVWNGLGNIAMFVGWIGVTTLTGYAAKAAGIMTQYAPFSWVVIGLSGGLLACVAYLILGVARNMMLTAKARREQVRAADTLDPMATIFQKKRIKVTDLINPYDQIVISKKFIDCEFIGPANIIPMLGEHGKFRGNRFTASDSVEIRDDAVPANAIGFVNCDIENCRFFKVTIFWQSGSRAQADIIISDQHWLTAVDEPQLKLEDHSDGTETKPE